MIDWWGLAANAMWITGAALALAVISFAEYTATARGEELGVVLRQPDRGWPLLLAAALFCGGLAAASTSWWQSLIGIGLALCALVQLVRLTRAS